MLDAVQAKVPLLVFVQDEPAAQVLPSPASGAIGPCVGEHTSALLWDPVVDGVELLQPMRAIQPMVNKQAVVRIRTSAIQV